jgi:hypothetical protein
MPAYTRDIHVPFCQRLGCERKATVEVFNWRNASFGYWCSKHGQEKVASLNRESPDQGT